MWSGSPLSPERGPDHVDYHYDVHMEKKLWTLEWSRVLVCGGAGADICAAGRHCVAGHSQALHAGSGIALDRMRLM